MKTRIILSLSFMLLLAACAPAATPTPTTLPENNPPASQETTTTNGTNIVITNIWVTNVSACTQKVYLAWTYENDVHYQMRYAPVLEGNYLHNDYWIDIGPEVIGPAHEYEEINSSILTQRFYRVVAPWVDP